MKFRHNVENMNITKEKVHCKFFRLDFAKIKKIAPKSIITIFVKTRVIVRRPWEYWPLQAAASCLIRKNAQIQKDKSTE